MNTIFGIRHHGPGCARSLVKALDDLHPDVLLIEMPAEAEPPLAHAGDNAFKPPVAILIHRTDEPESAAYYPFAEFSPEWQAVRWASKNGVPVRCIDLPAAHSFALTEEDRTSERHPDPFEALALADGYQDGERWWNDRVEERRDDRDFFTAILEAVTALRGDLAIPESRETLLREAWMRSCLRLAEKEYQNPAVICGAWHAPVLDAGIKASEDNALLKALPKHKVAATWIPWSYERLAISSGYRAGIRSPGWYAHLWNENSEPTISWITRAARILRKHGQEASSASVIEAVRLSRSLAGMRGRPLAGLDETLEAIQSIFCYGDPLALDFLRQPLLIGDRLGELPENLPMPPLQQEIDATIKQLRLKKAASVTLMELDLREDGGRNRSQFLHRLLALGIGWGTKEHARTRGTFKEVWKLQWKPELAVPIIEASAFGNTIESAAANRLVRSLEKEAPLAMVSGHLDLALLASLPMAVEALLARLDAAAASSHDTLELLDAVPPLVRIVRYGDVRATKTQEVFRLVSSFTERVHAELPLACSGINDDASVSASTAIGNYHAALSLLDEAERIDGWLDCLRKIADGGTIHPRLQGLAVRKLRDSGRFGDEETARHLRFALSPGAGAVPGAVWLEGFLQGSGSMLAHDHGLVAIIDQWLMALDGTVFQTVLPLIRRTFATFHPPERLRIASMVKGGRSAAPAMTSADIDPARALPAANAVAHLLGLPISP